MDERLFANIVVIVAFGLRVVRNFFSALVGSAADPPWSISANLQRAFGISATHHPSPLEQVVTFVVSISVAWMLAYLIAKMVNSFFFGPKD